MLSPIKRKGAKDLKRSSNGSSYEDCMAKIKAREADLVTLDAEHLYAAGTLIHTI